MSCGVPLLVWVALLLTVAFGWVARFTRTGRNLYALGSNPESARVIGINEAWHLALVFILSRRCSAVWSACCGARASARSTR